VLRGTDRQRLAAATVSPGGPDNGKELDNARFAQPRDLSIFVAELREYAAGILPQFVRRVLDRWSSMRELERGQRHAYRTIDSR